VSFEKLLLLVVGIVFVGAAISMMDSPGSGGKGIGGPAPDFTVAALRREQPWQLSQLRGQVVVLSFWATWCPPCRAELPGLEQIHKEFQGRPVTVLAVNQQEPRDTVAQFIQQNEYTFPVALDASGAAGNKFGVQGIPRLVLVGPDGRIVFDQTGYRSGQEEEIKKLVREHMPAASAPAQPAPAPSAPADTLPAE
jgi:peroxiredoxin